MRNCLAFSINDTDSDDMIEDPTYEQLLELVKNYEERVSYYEAYILANERHTAVGELKAGKVTVH